MSSAKAHIGVRETGASLARSSRRLVFKVIVGLAVASVYLFLYAPPIVTALFSFNSSSIQTLPFRHATFQWYRALFNDPQMQTAIYYSLKVALTTVGVAAVFTPKDYDATEIIDRVVDVIRAGKDLTT